MPEGVLVKRRFRLTRSSDFKRVRRLGKSFSHPLIVLIALPNNLDISRFAIAAGRSLGKAVQRNRAKRLIREAIRPLIPEVDAGWDVLLLARQPITGANLQQIQDALLRLIQRAELRKDFHGD